MLFNSFSYLLLFLPVVVAGSVLARRLGGARAAQGWVLAASLFFYLWWKPANLPYLLGSILVNWLLARAIAAAQDQRRKQILRLGLVLNVGYLCVFKYLNFFLRGFPFLASRGIHIPDLDFPLGISFFTLAQIMYLVDCYEGLMPASSLFDHATFTSFFPYVISGPISKAKRIVHQFPDFGGTAETRFDGFSRGLYLFSFGLCKKVILADAYARVANYGYSSARNLSALEGWIFAGAYTLQVYFDFSGYTDMAIGSAAMLGIQLPPNFDAPLRSKSIIEFWQRWHISLTNFITTYLYTPIVKSFRKATLTTASIATILSMSIAGLWHGPRWTFVVFGLLHGVGLAVNQYWKKKKLPKPVAPLSWLLTFLLVVVAFVFFRSATVPAAISMLRRMTDLHHPLGMRNIQDMVAAGLKLRIFGIPLLLGIVFAFFGKSSEELGREFRPGVRRSFVSAALFLIGMLFLRSVITNPFVYFAF